MTVPVVPSSPFPACSGSTVHRWSVAVFSMLTVLSVQTLLHGPVYGDDPTKPGKPSNGSTNVVQSDSIKTPVGRATGKSTAGKPTSDKPAAGKNAPERATIERISPERESAALAFARLHHPELATLLDTLQKNHPSEYQAALTELDRTVERLSRLKEKAPERHDVEVTLWRMGSRIRLLAARLSMGNDSAVELELRQALRERAEFKLAHTKTERDRAQKRLEKLNETVSEQEAKLNQVVEKEFSDLKKSLPPRANPKTKARRNEPNTPNAADPKQSSGSSKFGSADVGSKPVPNLGDSSKPTIPKSKPAGFGAASNDLF